MLCVVEQARGVFLKPSSCSLCPFAFCFLIPHARHRPERGQTEKRFPAKGRRTRRWRSPPRRDRLPTRSRTPSLPSLPGAPPETGQHGALTLVLVLQRRAARGQDEHRGIHHGGRHGSNRLTRVIGFPQHGQVMIHGARLGGRGGSRQSSNARMRAHFSFAAGLHQPK